MSQSFKRYVTVAFPKPLASAWAAIFAIASSARSPSKGPLFTTRPGPS